MNNLKICLYFAFAAIVLADLQNVIEYEMKKLLKNEQVDVGSWWKKEGQRPAKVSNFQWRDCGGSKSVVSIKNLKINDPVEVPGDLTISLEANVRSAITKIQADVIIYKKLGQSWIKVPCISGFGSCHYSDVCSMLQQIPQCPDPLPQIGISCKCPVKAKDYILHDATFEIDAAILEGSFHIIANATNQAGKEAACLDFYLEFD